MNRTHLSRAAFTLAAWISTIFALWAALAILNTIVLVLGEHIWAFKLEMAGGLALLSFLLAQTARWCFRKRKSLLDAS
jgi:hypothetical protein